MFVFLDEEQRILGLNPNDMRGNTGWAEVADAALTAHTGVSVEEMFDGLRDENGVALYKLVDGEGWERMAEEKEADIVATPVTPTPEEKLREDVDYLLIAEMTREGLL